MIISIQGKTQSKCRAASCAQTGFKAFSLSMMAANWWTSRWFGNFYLNANGWARHEQLGWVFPMENPSAGLWLWKRDLGWLWTDKEIYPFLYHNAQGGWLYFYGQRKGTLLFYDYSAKGWISKEDRQ